ncbi:Tn3 family transposase [Streptomyces sp. NBC_00057]|uniref:Tn3 family transposase n=1 Tax=Streptomyces sp. NBC_00057 TaxID=2975634 RepID=UPI003245148F
MRTVLRSSYSAHWRRMLAPLLKALEPRCNITAYRPVMDAIELLKRYLEQPLKEGAFFDPAETVPLEGGVPEQWRAAVVDDKGRVERIPYELCVLVSLRDALRRREIWVVGANRWRNPEDDLPVDFEDNRDVHYAALGQPQDADEFITALQGRLRASLDRFDRALAEGTTGGVSIVKKHGEPWIKVSPRGKQEEPESLVAIKAEIERCWGTIGLLDIFYGKDGFYGRDGDLAGQDKESQEVSMLALHLLQSALVHVNTLLMQQVLADPKWADTLTDADRRALLPLFWTHVNPYGRFELDMNSRLDLGLDLPPAATVPGPRASEGRGATAST